MRNPPNKITGQNKKIVRKNPKQRKSLRNLDFMLDVKTAHLGFMLDMNQK